MTPPNDLTTTQRVYMPLAKLHAGHLRVVNRMVAAYDQHDLVSVAVSLRYIELIEKKFSLAAQRVREYALSKARSRASGGGRSLGMKEE